MITSHVELNQSPTVIAPLPPVFPCHLEYLLSRTVFRAIPVVVVALADGACASATVRARGYLATDTDCVDER